MTKGLPKIKHPIFELNLPSTGEIVRYRPFTVKEEKILLLAQETKELDQSILAIKQVVNNCLLDKDIERLSMFDLEYILLMLRARSVDNIVTFSIQDPDTSEKLELNLDLNSVKLKIDENHSKEIRLNDDYVLFMRYPTINEFTQLIKKGFDDQETNFNILISCMDKLVSQDEVYLFNDFTDEEINGFAEDLDSNSIKKLKTFFETMPVLRHEIDYVNKEGTKKKFVIEGMQSFFI